MAMRLNGSILVTVLLSACAVGPRFERPPPPAAERYTGGALHDSTVAAIGRAGAAQHFLSGAPMPSRWWEAFHCDALNQLVDDALAHSPTVLEAHSRLRAAQEDLLALSSGTLYPSVDGQLGVTREKVDPAALGFNDVPSEPAFTLYNAQVRVSYSLDVFGANRRAIEGMQAQAEYQEYEVEAVRLTLAANVVAAAVRQAELESELEHTRKLIETQRRQLDIVERRYELGGVALEELETQRSQLEQLRAALPPLEAQRHQVDHLLAVYIGLPPARASIVSFKLDQLSLPEHLPVALPAELVRRRPDVRASEALWHRASAEVGVATANLFPHLSISGDAASERTGASDLVDGVNVWSIGAALMQPIFHAGELRAKKRSAVAAYDAAAHAYEQTVLISLQQVADSLHALEADAGALEARSAAAQQAVTSLGVAETRFALGGISELALLDVRRASLQASLERARAEARRYSDTAALMHALAGAP